MTVLLRYDTYRAANFSRAASSMLARRVVGVQVANVETASEMFLETLRNPLPQEHNRAPSCLDRGVTDR